MRRMKMPMFADGLSALLLLDAVKHTYKELNASLRTLLFKFPNTVVLNMYLNTGFTPWIIGILDLPRVFTYSVTAVF